jgi:HSP20 family protein
MAPRHHIGLGHDPFVELQREFNRLFDTLAPRAMGLAGGLLARRVPPVNLYEDKDALYVECEMPGVDQERLEVYVTGDVLTLKGDRPAVEPQAGTTVHIQERTYGAFNRAITLPVAVEGDKTEARYEHGVLSVKLPKAAEARPKQVTINVAGDAPQA